MAETVTINSVNLNIDGAWATTDLQPLSGHGPARGDNVTIPASAGTSARQPVLDEYRFALPMVVYGENNQSGTPYANTRQGLIDNLAYLHTNLHAAEVGAASVTITHTHPDSGTTSGTCQVRDIVVNMLDGQRGHVARVVLDVVVFEGKLS